MIICPSSVRLNLYPQISPTVPPTLPMIEAGPILLINWFSSAVSDRDSILFLFFDQLNRVVHLKSFVITGMAFNSISYPIFCTSPELMVALEYPVVGSIGASRI